MKELYVNQDDVVTSKEYYECTLKYFILNVLPPPKIGLELIFCNPFTHNRR